MGVEIPRVKVRDVRDDYLGNGAAQYVAYIGRMLHHPCETVEQIEPTVRCGDWVGPKESCIRWGCVNIGATWQIRLNDLRGGCEWVCATRVAARPVSELFSCHSFAGAKMC